MPAAVAGAVLIGLVDARSFVGALGHVLLLSSYHPASFAQPGSDLPCCAAASCNWVGVQRIADRVLLGDWALLVLTASWDIGVCKPCNQGVCILAAAVGGVSGCFVNCSMHDVMWSSSCASTALACFLGCSGSRGDAVTAGWLLLKAQHRTYVPGMLSLYVEYASCNRTEVKVAGLSLVQA
jgi:hypothetical protein